MTTELKAYLDHNGQELPLLPGTTPQQSLDHYSLTYPELATATIGEAETDVENNKIVYEVNETLGTKG